MGEAVKAVGGRLGAKTRELFEELRWRTGSCNSSADSSFPSSNESLCVPFCKIVGSCIDGGRGGKAGGSSKGPQELARLAVQAS